MLQQHYTISEQTLTLTDGANFYHTNYDDNYKVELTDQKIYGIVATMTPTSVTVAEWLDVKSQKPVIPNATGVGITIDLVVLNKVKGKEARSVFNALVDMLVGLIPTNLFSAMVEMQVLPLIVFSLLFGGVLRSVERSRSS